MFIRTRLFIIALMVLSGVTGCLTVTTRVGSTTGAASGVCRDDEKGPFCHNDCDPNGDECDYPQSLACCPGTCD